jgi:hypothetical protein
MNIKLHGFLFYKNTDGSVVVGVERALFRVGTCRSNWFVDIVKATGQ